jgi:adenosine deaminase CECR1
MAQPDQNHVIGHSLDESLNPHSPSVQKFFAEREALIAHEKTQRSGNDFRPMQYQKKLTPNTDHTFRQSLSPTALKAHSIVSHIRRTEHESIWSSSQAQDSKEELFPGMIFNSAKNHMESTSLYKIVKRMPKGAILHCHLGAMVDLRWLFGAAVETSGMCISSSLPLIDENSRRKAAIRIEYSKIGKKGEGSSIWRDEYEPLMEVPLKEAAESYPDGGKEGFISYMKNYCSITQSEALQHHLGIADIWKKLVAAFVMITPIVFYEPITRAFLREFFKTAAKDGVRWIEMRGVTRTFRLEGQDGIVEDRTSLPRIVDEEVKNFKATNEGKKVWGVRMIWDCLRSFSTEQIIDGRSTFSLLTHTRAQLTTKTAAQI